MNSTQLCPPAAVAVVIEWPQVSPRLSLNPKKRMNAKPIDYQGFHLYYRCEYHDGVLKKIVFSYREPPKSKRSKTGYGTIVLEKSYSPACKKPIHQGQAVTEKVVQATLDRDFIPYFLPKLSKTLPDILSSSTLFCVLGPYALQCFLDTRSYKDSTVRSYEGAMDALVRLFGNLPVSDVTPDKCAKIMLKAFGCCAKAFCAADLDRLFSFFKISFFRSQIFSDFAIFLSFLLLFFPYFSYNSNSDKNRSHSRQPPAVTQIRVRPPLRWRTCRNCKEIDPSPG